MAYELRVYLQSMRFLYNAHFADIALIVHLIPNPSINWSFMLVKTTASFVIYFAIRTTSCCNKRLAIRRFSYA